jgi:uncharacterized protein YjiK
MMNIQLRHTLIWLLFILSYTSVFAQNKDPHTVYKFPAYNFPYQLSKPDNSWKLPKALFEISGLSFLDDDRLACVQDEKGIIYVFNLKSGEIELKIPFADNGDFEGVEMIGNDAWVLKSNGNLYEVKDFMKDANPKGKKHTTALSDRNNAEGLAYDPLNKILLIACKGHPYTDKKNGSGFKAIYSYQPEIKKFDNKPFILISQDSIRQYMNYNGMTRLGLEIMAYLDPSSGDKSFQPSGIAVHPQTGNLYILGSVGKLLTVFTREGKMLAMIDLNMQIFPQPEGICFSSDGILYISNEGGPEGSILKFQPKK